MSTLLKDLYSRTFYNNISTVFEQVIPGFDKKEFNKQIFTSDFEKKELKERMRHTSSVFKI